MQSIQTFFPDADTLLALEPEELAGYLMEQLNSLSEREQENLNRYNFSLTHLQNETPDVSKKVGQAVMEAWIWLEKEGFLAPKPGRKESGGT